MFDIGLPTCLAEVGLLGMSEWLLMPFGIPMRTGVSGTLGVGRRIGILCCTSDGAPAGAGKERASDGAPAGAGQERADEGMATSIVPIFLSTSGFLTSNTEGYEVGNCATICCHDGTPIWEMAGWDAMRALPKLGIELGGKDGWDCMRLV